MFYVLYYEGHDVLNPIFNGYFFNTVEGYFIKGFNNATLYSGIEEAIKDAYEHKISANYSIRSVEIVFVGE